VVISKEGARPGQYAPMYKTECKLDINDVFTWNMISTDTDAIADS